MNDSIKNMFLNSLTNNDISQELYHTYSVKKGLRNDDGTGVLVGLTKISDVVGYQRINGQKIDTKGELYYRGINIKDIIQDSNHDCLFEEVCFLILFGYLPNQKEFDEFKMYLRKHYQLPKEFLEKTILSFPASHLMNKLQQEVLSLYEYDDDPDNIDVYKTLEKGICLIARIPSIVCYSFQVKKHNEDSKSMIIHHLNENYGISQLILSLLRNDGKFTQQEVRALEEALILHMDHGGGNNSTFTNIVIASTGTDLYSSIAGAIGSLKGPRHGGANLAVKKQMDLVIKEIGIFADDEQISKIVCRILDKDFNDCSGLIYGIGHAVYTLSDPRSEILMQRCKELSKVKNRENEFIFYQKFASIAIREINHRKHKHVCTNVDFYSGLLYDLLGIDSEMYPLLFVISRMVGWLAHNIENKLYANRIIRPASQYVGKINQYISMDQRE